MSLERSTTRARRPGPDRPAARLPHAGTQPRGNTLGSKAADVRVTNAAVDLKVLIEQMREQVQNIE